MKKLLMLIGVVAVLSAGWVLPAQADDEATVTATVSVQFLSVTLDQTTLVYGTIDSGSFGNLPAPASFIATNDGVVAEQFLIRGANTASWNLVSSAPGSEEYRHEFAPDGFGTGQNGFLTLNNQQLQTSGANVSTGDSRTIFLRLDAPTFTATTAQQSANVTVIAIAN